MNRRKANEYVDYQERALEFSVGDTIRPAGGGYSEVGRVTAVHPGIGYLDVEFAGGNERWPVDEALKVIDGSPVPPHTNSAPSTNLVMASDQSKVLSAIMKTATSGIDQKLNLVNELFRFSPEVKKLGFKVAFDLWASKDPSTVLDLLKFAAANSAETPLLRPFIRQSQGRKPFIASAWSLDLPSDQATRSLETGVKSNLVVASVRQIGPHRCYWKVGSENQALSGYTDSFKLGQEAVDVKLASLGFALR